MLMSPMPIAEGINSMQQDLMPDHKCRISFFRQCLNPSTNPNLLSYFL